MESCLSALFERLQDDVKNALKSRDTERLSVLRMLVSKVKDRQIELGRDQSMSDADVTQVLASYAKQRQEASEAFAQAGRVDLRDRELRERDIVAAYLPTPLDDDGIRTVLREVIAAAGATSMQDFGKVMRPAMQRLQGRADGNRVQALLRSLLGGA
jgi:hypothetical protein